MSDANEMAIIDRVHEVLIEMCGGSNALLLDEMEEYGEDFLRDEILGSELAPDTKDLDGLISELVERIEKGASVLRSF